MRDVAFRDAIYLHFDDAKSSSNVGLRPMMLDQAKLIWEFVGQYQFEFVPAIFCKFAALGRQSTGGSRTRLPYRPEATSPKRLVDGGLLANDWESLYRSISVNGLGQIMGYGLASGLTPDSGSVFLMKPLAVPEPSSSMLLLSIPLGLLAGRRRLK